MLRPQSSTISYVETVETAIKSFHVSKTADLSIYLSYNLGEDRHVTTPRHWQKAVSLNVISAKASPQSHNKSPHCQPNCVHKIISALGILTYISHPLWVPHLFGRRPLRISRSKVERRFSHGGLSVSAPGSSFSLVASFSE